MPYSILTILITAGLILNDIGHTLVSDHHYRKGWTGFTLITLITYHYKIIFFVTTRNLLRQNISCNETCGYIAKCVLAKVYYRQNVLKGHCHKIFNLYFFMNRTHLGP